MKPKGTVTEAKDLNILIFTDNSASNTKFLCAQTLNLNCIRSFNLARCAVADPEVNRGGFSKSDGPSGECTRGMSPPVGGGSGVSQENKKLEPQGALIAHLSTKSTSVIS